jgi:hypothetical protein
VAETIARDNNLSGFDRVASRIAFVHPAPGVTPPAAYFFFLAAFFLAFFLAAMVSSLWVG